jgi:RND superfamily putative drug exporter
MFARLGAWCHDHRKSVLAAWVVVLVGGFALMGTVGGSFREEFNLPASESKTGFDVLEEEFGGLGTNATGTIVFRADQGVDDPQVRAAMEGLFAKVAEEPHVVEVVSPYSEQGADQISSQGENAGLIAYANVEMPQDIGSPEAKEIGAFINEQLPEVEGLQVERGTFYFADDSAPLAEALGLAFAIVILILAFGSVLAMGLPVGVALFGVGLGTAVVTLLSNWMSVPEFATILGMMIGLGIGIDYALLIVTRYREELHSGNGVRDSVIVAIDTAGRSVVFAGCTVVISLLSMMLVGVTLVQSLAVAAASVAAVTVAASVTLLPALLGFAGKRVELTRWRGLTAAGSFAVAMLGVGLKIPTLSLAAAGIGVLVLILGLFVGPLKAEVPRRTTKPRQETFAYRWSRIVQKRPWTYAIGATLALILLAVPVASLRLGFSDESNAAADSTTKKAYDLIVDGFGPGFSGPLMLVAATPGGTTPEDLDVITTAVQADSGVEVVAPPMPNEDGTAALWQLVPTTGPQDDATSELVDRLRDDVLPPVEDTVGFQVNVSGFNAVNLDFSDYLQSRLLYVFAIVLLLSFVLLMVVFRSILVPFKAVVMNLLSIGAAYGVVVALFQWGWLSSITGVQPAPIEPWAPMMLFAIVFGLSMDYEVFLLSRVREEWLRTGDSSNAVADGLAATAKVITAAAAIMVLVFGSFLLELDRPIKLLGVGLAIAILLDATIVRMLLVPATMELLGDRNWWLPRWLDRLLPTIDVEGHARHDGGDLDGGGGGGSGDGLAVRPDDRQPAGAG